MSELTQEEKRQAFIKKVEENESVELIITNLKQTLFFEEDGVLSSKREDAKIFTSEEDADRKSIELQMMDSPVKWVSPA